MVNNEDVSRYAEPKVCGAKCRQTGEPCKNYAPPFGFRCIKHSGNTVRAREQARERLNAYLLWSTDPGYIKREHLRRWRKSNDRWEMRRARQADRRRGDGKNTAVAQLLAHRAAEAEEKQQIAADNARARAERTAAWKASRAEQTATETDHDFPGYDDEGPGSYGYDTAFDWSTL
ncbi:hypothetical protein GCM10028801_36140 [Nocardioides maradonensis]